MTQAEIHTKLTALIEQTLGRVPFDGAGGVIGVPASLQEALDCTSLEVVSVQMAVEETFGLEFGTGLDRGPIDDEWDTLRSVDDLRVFIAKWTEEKK